MKRSSVIVASFSGSRWNKGMPIRTRAANDAKERAKVMSCGRITVTKNDDEIEKQRSLAGKEEKDM